MSLMKEFKEFALRGNVVDMAVGIIIGAAFGKIVSSLVKDVIMPPIGVAVGGVDFSKLSYVIKAATEEAEAVAIQYGASIQTIVDFVIIALAIFMAIKVMNSLERKQVEEPEPEKPAPPTEEIVLLREIRDALQKS